MTRKPQTAWGLQVDWGGMGKPFIDPSSIRSLRKDAVKAFWAECPEFITGKIRKHFRTGGFRFVKVNITPVEDSQK